MIIEIVMPKMGESITEGTILEWRKKVGEHVEKDELFLEIGTDKVDSEIPCLEAGVIVEILASANDVVDVGTVIARIETDESLVDVASPSKKPIEIPESKSLNKSIMGEPPPRKKNKIDPVKVIAPIAAPKDISIRLAILIFPGEPKLNTSGLRKAEIATKTAARPTKL